MKRQYRYKTAADKKEFFQTDWFKLLDNAFDALNNAIRQDWKKFVKAGGTGGSGALNKMKDVWSKMKRWISTPPEKMVTWIDAYILPNDGCEYIMNVLGKYEQWYTDAWSFLDKDDYDKLSESIRKCGMIQKSLESFSKGKDAGMLVEDSGGIGVQLKSIKENIESLTDNKYDKGTDKSNLEGIQAFFDTTPASVIEDLNKIKDIIDAFVNDLSNNDHYWIKAKEGGSEICKRANVVMNELEIKLKNKKSDEEEERKNKKKEEAKAKNEEKDGKKSRLGFDDIMDIIHKHLITTDPQREFIYNKIKENLIETAQKGLNPESGETEAHIKTLVETSFVKFFDSINNRFDKDMIIREYQSNELKKYLDNSKSYIKREFDKCFEELLKYQQDKTIESVGVPDIKQFEINNIKDIYDKFIKIDIANMVKELKDHVQ